MDSYFKWVVLGVVIWYLATKQNPQPGPGPQPINTWKAKIDALGMAPDDRAKLGAVLGAIADAVERDGGTDRLGEPIEPKMGTTADVGEVIMRVVRYEALQKYNLSPLAQELGRIINPNQDEATTLDANNRRVIATLLRGVQAAC